jgi:hypothetical protein
MTGRAPIRGRLVAFRLMKWALLGLALALPAMAEKPRIAVLPFNGGKALHEHLAAALCKQAKCVPADSVLNAQHGPDWAKIAINGVSGVVSGRVVRAHHKQELELSVLVSAQQPAWTTTVPAEKLAAHASSKLVKEILQHLAGSEGELPSAPAPMHEEAPPPQETPVAAQAPAPAASPGPEPAPSETPEERAARAAAADQAFAAAGKGKRDAATKVAVAPAPKAEAEVPAPKPKPAPKAAETEPQPPATSSRGNYKPLPPELLSFTPRI